MTTSPGRLSLFWKEVRRRKVLSTGRVRPFDLAMVYAAAGNSTSAMDWMVKAYENQDANIPYVGINLFLKDPFKIEDPRLFELLDKMNLPRQQGQLKSLN